MKSKSLLLLLFFTFSVFADSAFLVDQKKFGRVKSAYQEKWDTVLSILKKENIDPDKLNILIVSFKDEGQLDVYGKNKSEKQYKKLKSYKICSKSGDLGPKKKQGDYQVPEGFYHIDRFNPSSSYYLSLGLNYPNESDKKKSSFSNLGGDIFIHGECVTIGCMPMTNIKKGYDLFIMNKTELKFSVDKKGDYLF